MRRFDRILLALVIVSLCIGNQVHACGAAPTTIGSYYTGTRQPGGYIVFTGAQSHDNDAVNGGATPRWEWDFDYHAPSFQTDVNTTSAYPSWTYNQAGVYTVAVRYFDNEAVAGNLYTFQITINGLKRLYYLKDHLGTIRATVDAFGSVVSADDYDPWGMQLEGRSVNYADANPKYKFTGKERDVETGYDWFEVRGYDSRIGRFNGVDPHADNYAALSPYAYCGNNPLAYVDPSGMDSLAALTYVAPAPLQINIPPIVISIGETLLKAGLSTAGAIVLMAATPSTANEGATKTEEDKKVDAELKEKADETKSDDTQRKTLQTGGNTLNKKTLDALGMTKEQGKRAIEGLKKDLGLRNDFHGKIRGNGDVVDPKTGYIIGNLHQYLH